MSEFFPWLVLLTCGLLFAAAYCLRLRMLREQKLERAANEFYERVKPLIEDSDTPESALDLIQFMNREITDGGAARRMFLCLLARQSEPKLPASVAAKEIHTYFTKTRPELGPSFGRACAAAMIAVSYQSRIFGLLVRRLVIFDLQRHQERAPDLLVSMRDYERFHGGPLAKAA